ncbi:MAG: Ig-like domain-containing protein, partial [Acidobacteriota bacterium]
MKSTASSSAFRNPIVLVFCSLVLFFLLISGLPMSSGSVNSLTAVEANNASETGEPRGIEPSSAPGASLSSASSYAALFAPTVTATKTASPASVSPGGTISYTVTISNASMDATGVNFTDTIDANTTLVPGSLKATPVAVNESYTATGNVRIQIPAGSGVLTNDYLGVPAATISAFDATSVNGGDVTVNADGSFSYNPPPGFEGADTFTYTLTNSAGSNSATVTITVSGMIWFINNNAGACASGCNGRLTHPFQTLAAFEAVNGNAGVSNPAAGDNIFIYESATAYTGPVTLENNQKLIGQDANGASLVALAGITLAPNSDPLPSLAPGGTLATITSAANAINVASGNTLRGFTVANSTTDIGGSNFGTLTIADVTMNGTGQALNLMTGTLTATSNISITSTSGATGFSLDGVGGSLTTSGTTNISGSTGSGILIQNSSATVNLGNVSVTTSGGTGVRLSSNTGTLTFADLDISPNANQRALHASDNTNTLTITSGTISNSGAVAVEITKASGTTPLQVSLTSVSANGGTNGIIVTNATGSFTVTGNGNTSVGGNSSGGTIQNTTSHAITLTNMTNPSFTNLNIQSIGRSGVDGQQVTNFTFKNGTINNVGTAAVGQYEESNIAFNDGTGTFTSTILTGTVSITQNILTNARRHGIQIENGNGTISNLTITNNTLTSSTSGATSLGSAILVLQQGSVATTAHLTTGTVTNNTISNFPSGAGIFIGGGSGNGSNSTSSTLGANGTPINISNNSISGASAANRMGTNAIQVSFNGQVGVSNFTINANNPMTNYAGIGVTVFMGGSVTGTTTVTNNTLVSNNTAGSSGIAVQADDGPAGLGTSQANYNFTINNNNISANEGFGVRAIARASLAIMDVTIQNNTVAAPTLTNRNGIRVDSGSAAGDVTLCMTMTGNTSAGSGVNQGIGIRKQGTVATVNDFGIVGLAPSPTTGANAAAKVAADNPAGGGVDVISGDNYVNCALTAGPIMADAITGTDEAKAEVGEATSLSMTDTLRVPHLLIKPNESIEKLRQNELEWLVPAAIERWRQAGISADELARLHNVRFELADLPNGEIARREGDIIKVDELAAGYGWFVDLTIYDDNEFMVGVPDRELQTTEKSLAHGKMDLLTVLMRGLGLEYLKDKTKTPRKLRPLMETTLTPSVRRVPNAASLGFIIPELASEEASGSSPVTPLRLEPASVSSAT